MLDCTFGIARQVKRFSGAARSRNPAARLGIFLMATGPFARLLDRIVYVLARRDQNVPNTQPPCLMIASPPRSGSTIIYQVLTRTIPCVYISNLHILFPRHASAFLMKKGLLGNNLSDFTNYYGYTSSIHDVSEGNEVIAGILKDSANKDLLRERFIGFVTTMKATRERPLIFKNVGAYSNIVQIHLAIPEIRFLRVKRDPEQIIQSVLEAYHELGTFNPVPPSVRELGIRDPIEFAVAQIEAIEARLDEQFSHLPPDSWEKIPYVAFCERPRDFINMVAYDMLKLPPGSVRPCSALTRLKPSTRCKASEVERSRIQALVQNRFR